MRKTLVRSTTFVGPEGTGISAYLVLSLRSPLWAAEFRPRGIEASTAILARRIFRDHNNRMKFQTNFLNSVEVRP